MELFNEFAPTSAKQWREQLVKDLKGIDLEKLKWHNRNGFTIEPFYTAEDLTSQNSALFNESNWDICEQITVTDEKLANERALKALKGGASGLAFYIHKKIDTKVLLKDISIEHIYTQFFISNDALELINDLKTYYGKPNTFDGKYKCFINIDPLSLRAFYGEWHHDQKADLQVINDLMHIPVNVSLYQEAGANTINELAIGLAHLNEYFNSLNTEGLLNKKIIHFTFSVNGDFYNEIAKLRAFRKLVNLLQKEYKTNLQLHIHVQTAQINKSGIDSYTNMLRTTTEGMSAVIGGCNSLSILPFNEGLDAVNDFSSRIAINQQHILKEESYLNKVADISAGSYYLETLTDQIAEKAWEQFKTIESKGGFIACLENNFIQELIEKDAALLINEMKEEQMIMVGVNKYQNNKDQVVLTSAEMKKKTGAIHPIRLAKAYEAEKLKLQTS